MRMSSDMTELTSATIPTVDSANEVFGSSNGLMVLRPGRRLCSVWLTVPEGCYAIVTKHGAVEPYEDGALIWPAGMHYAPPWLRVDTLVTQQSIVFDTPVKGCKTADDVTVEIDICLIIRVMGDANRGEDPAVVQKFVYELGPRGLQTQLSDAQEEAVRGLARSVDHTAVYALRSNPARRAELQRMREEHHQQMEAAAEAPAGGDTPEPPMPPGAASHLMSQASVEMLEMNTQEAQSVTEDMKRVLNDQFNRLGVQITDVIIEDVRLPANFVRQMSEKTTMIATIEEQKWRQQFDMQQLSYNEQVETASQTFAEEQKQVEQEGEREVTEIEVQLSQARAEAEQMKKSIRQQRDQVLQQIQADRDLEVTQLRQGIANHLSNARADARAECAALRAEAEMYREQKIAEAELEQARNEAQASKILASAEGRSAPMIAAQRKFEIDERRLAVFAALAENKDLVLSAESDDATNAMLLCDAILDDAAPASKEEREAVIQELLINKNRSGVQVAVGK